MSRPRRPLVLGDRQHPAPRRGRRRGRGPADRDGAGRGGAPPSGRHPRRRRGTLGPRPAADDRRGSTSSSWSTPSTSGRHPGPWTIMRDERSRRALPDTSRRTRSASAISSPRPDCRGHPTNRVSLVAIQPGEIEIGLELTPAVKAALPVAVRRRSQSWTRWISRRRRPARRPRHRTSGEHPAGRRTGRTPCTKPGSRERSSQPSGSMAWSTVRSHARDRRARRSRRLR